MQDSELLPENSRATYNGKSTPHYVTKSSAKVTAENISTAQSERVRDKLYGPINPPPLKLYKATENIKKFIILY